MPSRIKIEGPGLVQEFVLNREGGGMTVGRDAGSDIALSDPDRCISRKHLLLTDSSHGIEFRVTSSVNGIQTSRGSIEPGESVVLGVGDEATLGAYRIVVLTHEAPPAAAISPEPIRAMQPPSDDAFAALLGAAQRPAPPTDAFDRLSPAAAEPKAFPHAHSDALERLGGASNAAPRGSLGDFLGSPGGLAPVGRPAVPMPREPARAPGSQSLNAWLQDSAGSAGIPAASKGPLDGFLARNENRSRAISPDHVRDFDMPSPHLHSHAPAPAAIQPTAPAAPAALTAIAKAPAADIPPPSVWDKLLGGGATPSPQQLGPAAGEQAPAQGRAPVTSGTGRDVFWEPDGYMEDDGFPLWTDSMADALAPTHGEHKAADIDIPVDLDRAAAAHSAAAPAVQPAARPTAAPAPQGGASDTWIAFTRGLGLDPSQASDAEAAERAGRMTRLLIEGLADLLAARADLKRELRASERTMLSSHDNNPLKLKLTPAEVMQYLFAAKPGAGFMPAERAVRESILELRTHEQATIAAARAAVEGALRDFEPGRLKKLLHKGKPGLIQMLDKAKLWDAYQEHYDKQSLHMADWLESMFKRHFMPIYELESSRMKRSQSESEGPGD